MTQAASVPGSERDARTLVAWQRRLTPFMMIGLAFIAVVFFIGTFWNYRSLMVTMDHQDQPISESIANARLLSNSHLFADWYVRSVLEERALAGRQRQYNALVQSRLWTRMMGFLAGMVALMAGAVFILGKLETEFDGKATVAQGNWSMKTNSPGLVLVAAGLLLMVIALTVSVEVKSNDQLVYLPAFAQAAAIPSGPIQPEAFPAGEGNEPDKVRGRMEFQCQYATPTPPGCPTKK